LTGINVNDSQLAARLDGKKGTEKMSESQELFNARYGDRYFSADGGLAESLHVFVRGNEMTDLFRVRQGLVVAETGFGTGLNLLAATLALAERGSTGYLDWYSVEKFPVSAASLKPALMAFPELADIVPVYLSVYSGDLMIAHGWHDFAFTWRGIQVRVRVFHGDVLEMLDQLSSQGPMTGIDCWVLDGHSPSLNPDMWSEAVFQGMARCSRTDPASRFATYTAAGVVKRGLRQAGFLVRRQAGFGAKRHMISGVFAGLEAERSV
jgi:tRNA 5-methylaminomethyl-2-thiouridine biosynthesis bifunctional protein